MRDAENERLRLLLARVADNINHPGSNGYLDMVADVRAELRASREQTH